MIAIKNPAIADGVKCVCEVELDLEGSVLSCFGDVTAGGCINNDGDGKGWDVGEGPTEGGTGTSAIEVFQLFISQGLIGCLSLSSHWS